MKIQHKSRGRALSGDLKPRRVVMESSLCLSRAGFAELAALHADQLMKPDEAPPAGRPRSPPGRGGDGRARIVFEHALVLPFQPTSQTPRCMSASTSWRTMN
jgi:hypothetical protein